jgi:hypothetical protein
MNKDQNKMTAFPNTSLENELRARGVAVHCIWQQRLSANIRPTWIECLSVNGRPILVLTYADGNGWEAFTSDRGNHIGQTVEDVIARTEEGREDHHQAPEPTEAAPYCEKCAMEGHEADSLACGLR